MIKAIVIEGLEPGAMYLVEGLTDEEGAALLDESILRRVATLARLVQSGRARPVVNVEEGSA